MATKSIKVPVGKTVSWYVSEEGYVPQRGSYIMGNNTHSLNINLQTLQEAPLTMVFSGVAGTLSNIDTTKNVQYKRNDGGWTTAGSSIDVNPGDIIQFKGEYDRFDESTCWTLSSGVIIDKVCGNIGSVLDPVNYATMTTYSSTYALSYFFYGMRYGLIDAGDLVLPATTLTSNCYDSMFAGCALMTKVPALPATTLANYCYHNMFNNCDSLTVAPELPATTLANYCYSNMFAYCDGLTTAPDLLAETLAPGCYNYMFRDCSHLNYIKCMSHSTMRTGWSYPYTINWVNGVAAEGTFVSYVHNSSWTTGVSAIPTGWVNQTVGDQHTITIDPTPADATVVMNGVEQSSIYDWYGNTYTWSVSAPHYVSQSGGGTILGDETIPVTLALEQHTFTINTDSSNTVVINGEERNSITADYGSTITWSVSKTGYVTQNGIITLTSDTVIPVSLVLATHTFNIVPTPNNASVIINGQQRSSIIADYGTVITWSVSAPHYVSQSGSTTLTADTTLPVNLAFEQHTFTINPTPNDATVIINGEERSSVTVDYGTSISWSVAKSHYVTRTGSYTMGDNDYSLNVSLVLEQHTFTITPTPNNATVVINGQQRTSLTADYGTAITWSVSREHYITQTGSTTLTADTTLPITLALEQHTFTITPTPSDAMVIINGSERSSLTADYGTAITWSVSREGYTGQTGSYTLNQDHVENVSLVINQYTFTIDTDSNNTVVINGQQRTSITADYGTAITWSVSREHYITQSNTFTLRGNETVFVVLSLEQFTVTINPTPADATVTINGVVRRSLVADYGTTISWTVGKTGYAPQSGSIASLNENVTLSVELYSYEDDYMTFEIITPGTIIWKSRIQNGSSSDFNCTISYKRNNGQWTSIRSDLGGTTINVVAGDKVSFKGTKSCYFSETISSGGPRCNFAGTALFNVYGNILSMIYGDNYESHKTSFTNGSLGYLFEDSNVVDAGGLWLADPVTWINYTGTYERMFFKCTSLITAPNIPSTTNTHSYDSMFESCTALTTAPALPARHASSHCYHYMFARCTALTTAPALPATSLFENCYDSMFFLCTSLTTAPALPATRLAYGCYESMFWNCTSLTTAPALPATTLASRCYQGMFNSCTALTTAPELKATTLVERCYYSMFYNCDSLNYIKCLARDISAEDCTKYWLFGVPHRGTFEKNPNTTWPTGENGIPNGWTVIDAT